MSATLNPLERLQQLADLERTDITTLLAYGVGIGLMSLATPIAMQALVNTIAFGALFQPLLVLTLILLVLTVFSNTMAALQFYVVEMLQRRIFVRYFKTAAERLQQVDHTTHDHHFLPELCNRFFDVVTLQKTSSVLLLETLGYVLQTLIGMVLLAFYHPVLLAFDMFLIASLMFILFYLGKQGISTAIEQSKAKYAAAAWLENIATYRLLAKSAQNRIFLQQQTDQIAIHYLEACTRHFRILSRQNIGALSLHALANTSLLGLGGWMVIERQLSLGQLIAAELVVNTMIYGMTRLGKTLDNFYEMCTSIDKVGHLLDLPQESLSGEVDTHGSEGFKVELHHVSVPLNPQMDFLQPINLVIDPGERVVFSRGAEQGTILDLLFGLRTPSTGFLLLNKQNMRDLRLGQLRDSMTLVRDAEILEASIADNLRMGRDIDLNYLRRVLTQVGLDETVSSLPQGFSTCMTLSGIPLNKEQCLRLTLARAILTRPRLMMLDGVLDRLDEQTLPNIIECLFDADAPWTLILTSQLPEVIQRCNRHLQIKDGYIVNLTEMRESLI